MTTAINGFGGAIVQTASTGATLLVNVGPNVITLTDPALGQTVVTVPYANAGIAQSLTRDPDITGTTFEPHTTALGSNGAVFSPGTMIDGTPFPGCPIGP